MVVLSLHVHAEAMVVPAWRAIALGCVRARRVLAEPEVL